MSWKETAEMAGALFLLCLVLLAFAPPCGQGVP